MKKVPESVSRRLRHSRSYLRGAARLLSVLVGLILPPWSRLEAAPAAVAFGQSSEVVDVFDYVEVTIQVDHADAANPFTDVAVTGEFAAEGATPVRVEGFCDAIDGAVYRIRFMPRTVGMHAYSVRFEQSQFARSHRGTFTARDKGRPGLLQVDPERAEHFIWEGTGQHYFWNGTTTYYLMGWESDAQIREIIDRLARLKVNRLRVLLYGRNEDRPWGQPVKTTPEFRLYLNPWPATRPDDVKDPGFDLTRFDPSFWRKYERMLHHARDRDVIVSVIFFIGGQVLPTPFAADSSDEERFYRYGVARLAAFANVTWDLGNEHDFHREVPGWCNRLGPRVKAWDPYDHLTSAHNVIYRTPGTAWNDLQLIQRWDAGQNAFMLGERAKQAASGRVIPQINEEYGYEDLWEQFPGHRAADTRRRHAWEIAVAGCYQTTGETANRGTGFAPDTGGGWVNGRGDETMTMLESYGRMIDYFTSFEWWRGMPRNELVRGGAFCLADPGRFYAVYLPRPAILTLNLDHGNYRTTWFNPRTGDWVTGEPAAAPVWASPPPTADGDWALLLRQDSTATNLAPPVPLEATASLNGNEIVLTFNRAVDPHLFGPERFMLEPAAPVTGATIGDGPNRLKLTAGVLAPGTRYALVLGDGQGDPGATQPRRTFARIEFEVHDPMRPMVELCFNEARGTETANTGTAVAAHPVANLLGQGLAWSTNVPPNGGPSAIDFGLVPADRVVELAGDRVAMLRGLRSFTLSGWINCRNAIVGSGGNRILTAINHGGDGFDLVMLADGRLQLGVNQWPDGSPARSSAGRVPVDSTAALLNWRFFAVTYDATRSPAEVRFYFGGPGSEAHLDTTIAYDRGALGDDLGPVAVGHFNSRTRPGNSDRMFRGLIDDVRVYGSALDHTGALTLPQIRQTQAGKIPK